MVENTGMIQLKKNRFGFGFAIFLISVKIIIEKFLQNRVIMICGLAFGREINDFLQVSFCAD
jgi:hypothetical protein